jgi:uncharacterized repeat protein (TIGR03803 family)
MKHNLQAFVLLFALAAVFSTSRCPAQIFSSLYSFTNGSDGADPQGGLFLTGGTLFGTASGGGTNISGTAFAISTGGTGFSTLYTFSLDVTNPPGTNYTNTLSGTDPECVLVLSGNTLYGTGYSGGTNGSGTVFSMNTDGSGFNMLHTFGIITNYFTNSFAGIYTNYYFSYPCPGLVLSGNTLYGTTQYGGTNGNGTIFAVNTDGTGFTTLYTFTAWATNAVGIFTNADGANPAAGLALSGNTLYGTTEYGGTNGSGAVFAINTGGTGFTALYNFSAMGSNSVAMNGSTNNVYTNSDGAYPMGALLVCSNVLYGTAAYGGTNGNGTVFSLNPDGTGFVALHDFSAEGTNAVGRAIYGDGINPQSALVAYGHTLYGTAYAGGTNNCGTVFALNMDGTGFTTLHHFSQLTYNTSMGVTNTDGAFPYAGLTLYNNTLYGTTESGGSGGNGAVFALSLGAIPVNVQPAGGNLILTWGNPAFSLEAAPAINGPYATIPGATSPYVVLATNSMQFYQLLYGSP